MTAPSLLDELEEVVRHITDDAAEVRRTGGDPERERYTQRIAVNFIRTRHAEIADMAKRLEAAERDASHGRCKACGRATRSVCDGLDGNGLGCTNAPPIDIAATQEGEG